jgi:hypothetical protein
MRDFNTRLEDQDTDQKFVAQTRTVAGLDNTAQVYLSSMLANGGFYSDSGTERYVSVLSNS